MSDPDIEDLCKKLEREIATRPICEPIGDEFVAECPWSRTNWAIWQRYDGGRCTCRPALKTAERNND